MRSPSSLCVRVSRYQLLNSWTNLYETWYVFMAPTLNGVLHKSLPSVCVSVCVSLLSLLDNRSIKCIPHNVARQQFRKYVPVATNTGNNRRIPGSVIFYVVLVLWKESVWVCLSLCSYQLGKYFPGATKNYWRRRFLCGPCPRNSCWRYTFVETDRVNVTASAEFVFVSNLGWNTGYRYWGYPWFSSDHPGKYLDSASIRPRPHNSKYDHQSIYIWCTCSKYWERLKSNCS
jgi:hypothetical protein